MDVLNNLYVYSAIAALSTAALGLALMYVIDPPGRNSAEYRRTFVRVFITAMLVNMTLQYFLNTPEPVATEPYAIDATDAEL